MSTRVTELESAFSIPGLPEIGDVAAGLILLPRLLTEAGFVFSTNTDSVAKLLRENGLEAHRAPVPGEPLFREERAFTWLGPVIFISAAMLAEHPHIVSVSLSVIANYLTDIFRGQADTTRVKLDVIVETTVSRRLRQISYDGPVSGLKEIASAVEEAVKSDGSDA